LLNSISSSKRIDEFDLSRDVIVHVTIDSPINGHLPYGISVTCHQTQVNKPCLTPDRKAGTQLTYSGGKEG